jgi:FtsZ-binding cell division protein ZapB
MLLRKKQQKNNKESNELESKIAAAEDSAKEWQGQVYAVIGRIR